MTDEREGRIRGFLAQGSWRKARDEAKELCKLDRGRYLPLLVEANAGLARDMLARNLVSEARQVIAYLKTIAPRSIWESLELEAAMKSGDYSAAAADALRALDQGRASADRLQRSADQLVLAFQTTPYPASATAVQAAAIQGALEAICAGDYNLAAERIRPIPHDSAFRHWKLFVKGLAACHRGDHERSAHFLAALPADSVPGRAALPYLHWLGKAEGRTRFDELPDHCRELVATLAGAAGQARLLARAEGLWQEGQIEEMYNLVRQGIDGFPSEQPDWLGTLTDFCINCLSILPPEAHGNYEEYLHSLVAERRTRSAREAKMLWRIMALSFDFESGAPFASWPWEQFLALRTRLDGPNPRLDSQAYQWIGTIQAGINPLASEDYRSFAAAHMPDAKGAMRSFRKSIEADPGNLESHLALAMVLDRLKRKGERNRLLDVLTKRFPDNKHVLMLAAGRCIDRKAFVKGLALMERALAQDKLDPEIPDRIVTSQYLQAEELFRRGRPVDAHRALDAAEVHAVDRPDDFRRSRWTMLLRRGILDRLYGGESRAAQDLAQARSTAPSLEAYLLMGHIVLQRYRSTQQGPDPFAAEFDSVCPALASAAQSALLLRVLDFWSGKRNAPSLRIAMALVRNYLEAAANRTFTRAEGLEVIESIQPGGPHATAARRFIKALLKKDGGDPLLRLHDFQFADDLFLSAHSRRKKLNGIMKEAVRRKDEHAIKAIRHELDKLDSLPPPPSSDEEFEPEDFDTPGIFDEIQQDADPRTLREMEEMKEFLRRASEAEIRRLRKTLPRGFPPEIFDLLVEEARDLASEPRPAQPRKPSRRNPAQKGFFEL
jgi:hypothetical protein